MCACPLGGIAATREITRSVPGTRVLILTVEEAQARVGTPPRPARPATCSRDVDASALAHGPGTRANAGPRSIRGPGTRANAGPRSIRARTPASRGILRKSGRWAAEEMRGPGRSGLALRSDVAYSRKTGRWSAHEEAGIAVGGVLLVFLVAV